MSFRVKMILEPVAFRKRWPYSRAIRIMEGKAAGRPVSAASGFARKGGLIWKRWLDRRAVDAAQQTAEKYDKVLLIQRNDHENEIAMLCNRIAKLRSKIAELQARLPPEDPATPTAPPTADGSADGG